MAYIDCKPQGRLAGLTSPIPLAPFVPFPSPWQEEGPVKLKCLSPSTVPTLVECVCGSNLSLCASASWRVISAAAAASVRDKMVCG